MDLAADRSSENNRFFGFFGTLMYFATAVLIVYLAFNGLLPMSDSEQQLALYLTLRNSFYSFYALLLFALVSFVIFKPKDHSETPTSGLTTLIPTAIINLILISFAYPISQILITSLQLIKF
jgi:hypothetical protein